MPPKWLLIGLLMAVIYADTANKDYQTKKMQLQNQSGFSRWVFSELSNFARAATGLMFFSRIGLTVQFNGAFFAMKGESKSWQYSEFKNESRRMLNIFRDVNLRELRLDRCFSLQLVWGATVKQIILMEKSAKNLSSSLILKNKYRYLKLTNKLNESRLLQVARMKYQEVEPWMAELYGIFINLYNLLVENPAHYSACVMPR
jgi:hypothetical protein